ncbi:MAG: hypothetical protein NEA02_02910, partial [Thermoanaerobaculia bacterium]|nr:hypothetical protein [Thermoanaerobaculia bacterium]
FRLTDGPGAPQESQEFEAAVRALEKDVARLAPPFGTVHLPAENQKVAPGFWCHGWALDDSGIAEIRVAVAQSAAAAPVQIGRTWPGLAEAFPDYEAPGNGGYGFLVPDLPAGPHELRITLVGRDGGETVISRRIVVGP